MSCGLTSHLRIMALAASTEIVIVSSSGAGTDLQLIISPLLIAFPSAPQTFPISSGEIL
jgi:hypothetical protein